MKQFLALVALGGLGFGYTAATARSVPATTAKVQTFAHQMVVVERAVQELPCVLAPAGQRGCPPTQ